MKVYVLNRGYDYEGEETLGVYAERYIAVEEANLNAQSGWLEPGESLNENKPNVFTPSPGSSVAWYVHEFAVVT